jgi:hypothetical protein
MLVVDDVDAPRESAWDLHLNRIQSETEQTLDFSSGNASTSRAYCPSGVVVSCVVYLSPSSSLFAFLLLSVPLLPFGANHGRWYSLSVGMVIFVARQRTAWMYLLLVASVKPHFSSVPGPGVVQFQFSAWNGRTMQVLYASNRLH